ncbi:MAG TPA: DinB family protein [Terriglobales bacterium]|jgi:uncharacterized damage-inducible protein DinB
MQETTQQYIQRMLGNVEGKDPLKIQESTPKKLAAAIKGKNRKQLDRRPAPGKWSITEILAHLADTELVAGWRLRLILGQNGAPVHAFDQDVWAGAFHYQKTDPKKSLELFRVLREANLAVLKSLSREQWENYGMHQERGKETIGHIVRMFAGHDVNHVAQVEQLAKAK